jgi:hypothetical protein
MCYYMSYVFYVVSKNLIMKKIYLLLTAMLFTAIAAFSQDKIYRNNGKVVEAKILEVGSSEIKYKEFRNPDGPIYILETDRIKKIVYENGTEEKFKDNLSDPERYAGQANKALKVNFFAPLYGYTEVSFEKSNTFGRSYEISLGVIGAGKSEILTYYDTDLRELKREPFGFFVSGGYKFGKLPDFIIFGKTRASHQMQGTYVKPILYLGHYKENKIVFKADNSYEIGEQNVTFGALQIEVGKQWVLGQKLVLDIYSGMGYGVDNKKDSYTYESWNDAYANTSAFNYANARVGKSPGLSFTFGLKMGLLLK